MNYWKSAKQGASLVITDAFLQGMRYVLLLYIGYVSIEQSGAYLFGGAVGFIVATCIDFGMNQHVLRLSVGEGILDRSRLKRAFWSKATCTGLFLLLFHLYLFGDETATLSRSLVIAGAALASIQVLGEMCETVCIAIERLDILRRFRMIFGFFVYGTPIMLGAVGAPTLIGLNLPESLHFGACVGLLIVSLYISRFCRILPDGGAQKGNVSWFKKWGTEVLVNPWKGAGWLGINQLAVVTEVRVPLIVLGLLIGNHAVGLYGLVQRTLAIVELVLASLSKLLLRHFSQVARGHEASSLLKLVLYACGIIGIAMAIFLGVVGMASFYVEREFMLSENAMVGLEILRWSMIAIFLSALKRPLVLGLMAVFSERNLARIYVWSVGVGIVLHVFLIHVFGIWGSVMGWIITEALIISLLILKFRNNIQDWIGAPVFQSARS